LASIFTPTSQGEEVFAFVGTGENPEYPANVVVVINQVNKTEIARLQFDEATSDQIINLMATPINTFAAVFK